MAKVKRNITISREVFQRLQVHIEKNYGPDSRMVSATFQKALREFLDREAQREKSRAQDLEQVS